ncbi:MAG: hypothetical protein ACYC7D_11415 [Nitrososphaerales archaeon]
MLSERYWNGMEDEPLSALLYAHLRYVAMSVAWVPIHEHELFEQNR